MLIIYDKNCPICIKNKEFLHKLDRKNRLEFIDTHTYFKTRKDIEEKDLLYQIHVINDGELIIQGMDAIRVIYKEIGYNTFVQISNFPGLKFLFNTLYKIIAKHRSFISRLLGLTKKH